MAAESAVAARNPAVRRWRLAVIGTTLAGLVLVGTYTAGEHRSHVHVHDAVAYAGYRESSWSAAGWTYGISDSVTWFDGFGTRHDSGWPDCLAAVGTTARIRFAETTVRGPDQSQWRQVLWVDCRG